MESNITKIKHMLRVLWDCQPEPPTSGHHWVEEIHGFFGRVRHTELSITFCVSPLLVRHPELDWLQNWLVVALSTGITLDCWLQLAQLRIYGTNTRGPRGLHAYLGWPLDFHQSLSPSAGTDKAGVWISQSFKRRSELYLEVEEVAEQVT